MKNVHIMGGGTFSHVRPHLALAAPAFGSTARLIYDLIEGSRLTEDAQGEPEAYFKGLKPKLWLSRMARSRFRSEGDWVTNEDVVQDLDALLLDPDTKVIFFSVALCDFNGSILDTSVTLNTPTSSEYEATPSGKDQPRLMTAYGDRLMRLTPADKVLSRIRKERKDIFLVAFKTTAGATPQEQYELGLSLLKRNSCNLVLANDLHTRLNMVIVPELGRYYETTNRREAITGLVDMASKRSGLTFTRTKLMDGKLLPWREAPEALQKVVDYCVNQGAYKPFNNITVGHFGFMDKTPATLYSSRRKKNFNQVEDRDLVGVSFTPEGVIAYKEKPSAGATSQQLVLKRFFPKYDCIVHFHCPLKPGSSVALRSQHDFECGSLECGKNTVNGMHDYGDMAAVMLDKHGPNIVFHHDVDPADVVAFIEANFDLSKRTGDDVSSP